MCYRPGVPERRRLAEARDGVPWRKWGPYLSERQWGTVREDYSDDGNAWAYFTHDQARARAYRWGEDGLAGFADERSRLCFALALWNGVDPILKERLFGLTNAEGNHGEDVKEYYYYLDATPTHSYLRWLYKYPQRAFPYADLVDTNRRRRRDELEYELIDTGVFADDRYFDVEVEYAKAAVEDIGIRITVRNRGPAAARVHVLPTLWFRNTWSWGDDDRRPLLRAVSTGIAAEHADLGRRWLHVAGAPALLFTENESNCQALWGQPNRSPYVKDAFHRYLIGGETAAVNPARTGTKAAAAFALDVPAGGSAAVHLLLTDRERLDGVGALATEIDALVAARRGEADAFYASLLPAAVGDDERQVFRQALAGMLWSKQHYYFNLDAWLEQHGAHPLRADQGRAVRNRNWFHMVNDDVISMPDKWEYPWFAAWDLAFHCIALAVVDIDFAKQQLELMLRDLYLHPSGQIPAYEWNFGDVNPPVHAWATLVIYFAEKGQTGAGDVAFLKSAFQKLLVNFTWWLNRKDPSGRNVFEGGFLGLDNIGVFDRSAPLPTGGTLEQADGTAWMALFAQNMFEIALELAQHDATYVEMALKFAQHFLWIAAAMDRVGDHQDELWDEADGFFYDVLRLPDGTAQRLRVRSMVGLLSLCATTVIEPEVRERFPEVAARLRAFLSRHPEVDASVAPIAQPGMRGRRMLAVLDETKLRRVLRYLLDEGEFLGPHGIRALSRHHLEHPFVFRWGGEEWRVGYEPAESSSGLFGGNSNWRGPVWMPVNLLILRALGQFYSFYGDDFRVECPTGSGRMLTLYEVTREITGRLIGTFLRGPDGRRPVFGGNEVQQRDPHWRDLLLFYEYFHGDNGAGLGASHQTGWTGVVAYLIHVRHAVRGEQVLASGLRAAVMANT
ncbi:glucosidase [bacterium]|nr:glucosidase [bacterium]